MSKLWLLLLAFLTLGVDESDPNADPATTAAADETFEDLLDVANSLPDGGETPPEGDEPPDNAAALKEARRRQQETENQLNNERAARAAAEARAAPPQRYVDPDWQREEDEIAQARAKGATAEQLGWLQWKVDGNRKIRQTERNSFGALLQAQDLTDKAAFDRLEVTKPKFYQTYAPRVEAAMAEMRSRGQNAPRLAVLRLLIGDDIMSGKIKPKAAGATVDRGRTPGVRSDTTAKGKLTEHQKRTARLADRLI